MGSPIISVAAHGIRPAMTMSVGDLSSTICVGGLEARSTAALSHYSQVSLSAEDRWLVFCVASIPMALNLSVNRTDFRW